MRVSTLKGCQTTWIASGQELAPPQGANHTSLTGGLRFAPTSGYLLRNPAGCKIRELLFL
jgi:hypothetical protein